LSSCIFTTSTAGGDELNGLDNLVSAAGTGTIGGIDSSVETWWKNYATHTQTLRILKQPLQLPSTRQLRVQGHTLQPKFMISGVTPYVMYESGLADTTAVRVAHEADAGFKVLKFKDADYIFSQYGGTKVYFLNPKNYQIVVSKTVLP
jgi:hypothetical protein